MSEYNVKQSRSDLLTRVWRTVSKEPVLAILVLALGVLQVVHPRSWASLPGLVDWQTVLTLAGLLILTKAIELSGFLMWAAHRLVHHIHGERGLALLLVALAAALSTVLTNDVALFAVVPLALSLHRLAPLPIKRLVIVIALSVNAGSILTPLGNPQNLFLWQTSGVSFGAFVWALLPLCAVLMLMLGAVTCAMFRNAPLDLSGDAEEHGVDRVLCGVSVLAFAGFVALADAHHAGPGLAVLAVAFLLWRREVVLKIDWLLLLIFMLMFIVLRSAAALPAIHGFIAQLGIGTPMRAYAAGAVLSQAISNVPAAIVLAEFSKDWRALAFGVSVGGFGVAIGSLANLIAVRLSGEKGMWGPFHLVSIPFWFVAALVGWALI
ncbi:SLC13 family permease [Caballeronia sp. LP006]|uniref:SLC13 family permease n=1 Tax=unclassified Caballeronia TaxID=2646786 RepID=UPI001FD0EA77|nr:MULTISPECIES: SLC13 family permease [unclassified Caballeronia]MDR5772946.1 SLC13 family permease [Caballeronia sp. LZ002]MDR5829823.1 SLC13 family permease [Caballeronia sp. LP006]MDR5848380.1 SLC13 family permease [Caballeronia sp. LZ003]